MTKEDILAKSIDWIRSHPDATTHDVPQDLVQLWLFDSVEDFSPVGAILPIFIFGYTHCLARESIAATGRASKITHRLSDLVEKFQLWQLKLSLVQVEQSRGMKFQPMPLFSFPDGETAEFRAA
jgi:hypothetical protein